MEVTAAREYDSAGDREWITAFCSAMLRLGPRAPTAGQIHAFAHATGLTPAQARWVLEGFPPEADVGLNLSSDAKLELLASAAPLDPTDLWSDAGAEGLAAMWVDSVGKTVALPSELTEAVGGQFPEILTALGHVASPASWAGLRDDARWEVTRRGEVRRVAPPTDGSGPGPGPTFEPAELFNFAQVTAWLIERSPVGDPLLINVLKVYEQVRLRLQNPEFAVPAGVWSIASEQLPLAEELFDAFGGQRFEVEDVEGQVILRQARSGPLVATFAGERMSLAVDPIRLDRVTRSLAEEFGQLSLDPQPTLRAVEVVRSEDFASLLERVWRTPLAPGEWEQDPSRSAQHVVRIMARRFKLSEPAAALYLQSLVLLAPTRTAVRRWNRWTEATWSQAGAELVRNGLLVQEEEDSERLFLPGERVDFQGSPPFEAWKLPLYGWDGTRFPLDRPLLLAPLHVLYARAWERCISADPPSTVDR
jgi:hypothetical protein